MVIHHCFGAGWRLGTSCCFPEGNQGCCCCLHTDFLPAVRTHESLNYSKPEVLLGFCVCGSECTLRVNLLVWVSVALTLKEICPRPLCLLFPEYLGKDQVVWFGTVSHGLAVFRIIFDVMMQETLFHASYNCSMSTFAWKTPFSKALMTPL